MALTRLTADRRALAAAHVDLARRIAGRWARRCNQRAEEWEGAAFVGLVEAAGRYDPARGAEFRTFAAPRIWGALRDEGRAVAPLGYRRDLDHAPMVASGESDDQPLDLAADELPVGWEVEAEDAVLAITRRLSNRKRDVVRLYYLHAATARIQDVAASLGISQTRVSHHLVDAVGELSRPPVPVVARTCPACGTPIPAGSSPKRRYCGERCRIAAKNRRRRVGDRAASGGGTTG